MRENSGTINKNSLRYSRFADLPGLELFQGIADTRSVSRHVHDLFCITIAETGIRICETKKGRYYLTPGAIFISNRGEAHSGTVPKGHTYSCRSLRLDAEILDDLAEQLGCGAPDFSFTEPLLSDPDLYQKLLRLHASLDQAPSTAAREYQLLDVFSHLTARYTVKKPASVPVDKETAPVRRVREYLHDSFAENVSIKKLAAIAALSPFHLSRVFEKEVGVPPHVYQLDIRLTKAARLISLGKPIVDVAIETGFFDQSHFHKAFQRKFGVTPKRYMQNKEPLA